MTPHVWIRFDGPQKHDLHHAKVARALADAGIEIRPRGEPTIRAPGLLFCSAHTPDLIELLRTLSGGGRERVLAVVDAADCVSVDNQWELLRAGASDVVHWRNPTECAGDIAARLQRWQSVDETLESPLVRDNLVGGSAAWQSVLRQIVEVAGFTDATVLVTGESGTGKELAARLIHTLDPRPDKRELVVLDCTTVVPELSGSEFFGHERGAFTGAIGPRDGAFALADGGTLFLDEVGELPLGLQAQLLRVVQEHSYKRVGGNRWLPTDFRLICATNRNLDEEVAHGRFRADLYYRISNWVCELPPLRERPDDILLLVRHFLARSTPHGDPPELERPVRDYLLRRPYPGNVRELKQLVSRISARHVGLGPITVGDIPEDERPAAGEARADWRDVDFERVIRRALCLGVGLRELGQYATDTAIRIAVSEEAGNLHRAALRLKVTDRALQMRRANHRPQARAGTEVA
jgi:transcriptional regulator with GAF, ATPase, and Fis domain